MIEHVKKMCKDSGVTLLYLTKFGSHLYGTNTPSSDVDYKGIYLPSFEQCCLQQAPKSLTYSTGDDGSRNNSSDVDIQLWSLQYFFTLVERGDINALDLLYSGTYKDMHVYVDDIMWDIFYNHAKFYNLKKVHSYIGYAKSQVNKYGMKFTRSGVLKAVYNFTKTVNQNDRLSDHFDYIMSNFYDDSLCFIKKIGNTDSLVLCGKVHQGSIKISEFSDRIKLSENKNQNIDWKAVSHAVRSISQMEMLIDDGIITFPLKNSAQLILIKEGKADFSIVETIILDGLQNIKNKIMEISDAPVDKKFISNIILSMY